MTSEEERIRSEFVAMTEYERGFNDGFAAALTRMERATSGPSIANSDFSGSQPKISIGFREDQFEFIKERSSALACSFGASVRFLIDKAIGKTL